MEEKTIPQTPMVNIWFIVALSMLIVCVAGAVWHWTKMEDLRQSHRTEVDKMNLEIDELSGYRDALKSGDALGASEYLQISSSSKHGI